MTTVAVRLEWAGAAEEVLVAGEFNGWAKVPLVKEQELLWALELPVEPGCYTFRFLVDGTWKVREGDEVEEDENGEKVAVLIVEEEDEEEVEETKEVEEAKEEESKALTDAVSAIEEDLDTLTINIDEKTKEELQCGTPKPAKKETTVANTEKTVAEVKPDVKEEAKPEKPKAVKAIQDKENQENTPKATEKTAGVGETATPKRENTPVIKAGKLGKLHPDDVVSPRRVTRNLLAKMAPKN